MLELFVRNVQEQFPKEEAAKVERFADAIARSTSDANTKRGAALLPLGIRNGRRHEIKQLHQEWKDTWFGVEFGLSPSGFDVGTVRIYESGAVWSSFSDLRKT